MRSYGDEAQRTRALIDLSATLLVEAAAGTGKTSLLAGRVVMLLASGIHPRNIAAISFTELAAGELRLRVSRFVRQLLSDDVPIDLRAALPHGLSPAQVAALTDASLNLDELTSATIHGFCNALLCSYAVEADVDPGAQVLDATHSEFTFRSVFDRWLGRRLGTDGNPLDPIAVMARWDPEETVEILRDLGAFRRRFRTAQPAAAPLQPNADVEFVEAVRAFRRWFNSVSGPDAAEQDLVELETLVQFYEGRFAPVPDIERLWALAHPPRVLIMYARSFDLRPYQHRGIWGKGVDAQRLAAQAVEHYEQCAEAFRALLGRLATRLVAAFSRESDELLNDFERFKRSAALLDFDDLLLRTRALLNAHEAVRLAVADRFRRVLVDEFQDTDPVQSEILFLITGEPGDAPGWQTRRLAAGRLFLVGDPKQAIYRFRGADVACYMEVRGAIERAFPGNILRITSNFRSRQSILDHVNSCFAGPLGGQAQGYVSLHATRGEARHGLPCVAKVTIPVSDSPDASALRDQEAKVIADLCARLIGNVEIERPDGARALLTPGDIVLLAPAGTDLWRYERALEDSELPFVSQAGKNLFRRQETQDFIAITRVLADSRDTLALGALLRGPIVGLTEEELLDIALELPPPEGLDTIATLSLNTEPDRIRHPVAKEIITVLRDLRRKVRNTTPLLLLGEALERLNVRPVIELRGADQSPRALANLNLLLERARAYAVGGLNRFARDLHEDWRRTRGYDEARIDAHGEAIEIITVHSAKGLEWPVVIPINTGTEFRRADRFIYRRHDNTLHWTLGQVVPPALADALALDHRESMQENERLLYVACTRATDLLVVPYLPTKATQCWANLLDLKQDGLPEFPLERLQPKRRPETRTIANEQTLDVFNREAQAVAAASASIRWIAPSEHDPDRTEVAGTLVEELDQVAEAVPVAQGSALRGTILHKLIEEVLTGEVEETETALHERAGVLLTQLGGAKATGGPNPAEMAKTAMRTLGLAGIAERRKQIVPEIPIYAAHPDRNSLVSGRADAIAVGEGGPDTVFDWKSDIAPTDKDRAAYRAQLLEYIRAVGAKRGGVVYMTIGQINWVEA